MRDAPPRRQIEQLASVGNSFYHGLTLEARTLRQRTIRLGVRLDF